jgi:hypothetical protein
VLRNETDLSRREILAGALSTAAAAALPVLSAAAKPDWLIAAEADLKANPWWGMRLLGPAF